MNIFWATFIAIFLAELADKTQLVSLTMASKSQKPITVFIASVLAYSAITLISVFLGSFLSDHIKPETIKFASGILFLIIGILIILGKF